MLVKDKNGELIDTHEQYNEEREERIEQVGQEIIDEFEEEYVDSLDIHWYSDYSGECQAPGVYVDYVDTPNYDEMLEDTIQEHIEDDMDEDFIKDLKDYVKDNVASDEYLQDIAIENYEPPEPDYDD